MLVPPAQLQTFGGGGPPQAVVVVVHHGAPRLGLLAVVVLVAVVVVVVAMVVVVVVHFAVVRCPLVSATSLAGSALVARSVGTSWRGKSRYTGSLCRNARDVVHKLSWDQSQEPTECDLTPSPSLRARLYVSLPRLVQAAIPA